MVSLPAESLLYLVCILSTACCCAVAVLLRRSNLASILLLHLLLLDLIEPAQDFVFKLLVDGVHKAGFIHLELERLLEELCLRDVLLEDGGHQLQHVCLEAEHFQHLHHKPAKSLASESFLYLYLVAVHDLIIVIHVISEVGESYSLALFSPGKQVPCMI